MRIIRNLEELEQIRSNFNSLTLSNDLSTKNKSVSLIIHQIYLNFKGKSTKNVPDKWKSSGPAWRKYHPSCTYVLWNNQMLDELIKRYYPHFLDVYQNYYHPIQQVDSGRAFILHRYGGVYSDLDLEPKTNIWNLFDGQENVYLVQDSGRYTNMLMASPPGSSFWPELWKEFRDPKIPWWAQTHHFYIQTTTGPLALDRVAKSYHHTIGLLPGFRIQPCTACEPRSCTKDQAYFIMLSGGSWNKLDSLVVEAFACHWVEILIVIAIIVAVILIWYLLWRTN